MKETLVFFSIDDYYSHSYSRKEEEEEDEEASSLFHLWLHSIIYE